MNKKAWLFIVSLCVGLILLYYNYSKLGFEEVLKTFEHVTWPMLLLYFAIIAVIELLLVLRWRIVIRAFKLHVPYPNLFLYKMAGYAVGYMSPQAHVGGEPVRALMLKRHGIPFKKGISTVLIDKSMTLATDILFVTVGAAAFLLHFSISRQLVTLLIIFIIAGLFLVGLYFYCMIKRKPFFSAVFQLWFLQKCGWAQRIRADLLEIEAIIHEFYVKHYRQFVKIIALNLVLYTLMFLEYSAALMLFGFAPNPYTVLIVMGAVAISYSMPVPMALGVLETTQVGALGLINRNQAAGLSISVLVRFKDLLRTLIGGLTLLYYGVKNIFNGKNISPEEAKDKTKA